jgi:hypothetical protein
MKHRLLSAAAILLVGCGVVLAVGQLEQAAAPIAQLPALLPEGALLSIEARDFSSLLKDWNTSPEKRTWLLSDNYAEFSNSRLFSRLSQAKDELSAAAGLPTDASLLEKVAGKESCLGLYDIGNLEFVYVTRLDQQDIENTPLWQTRSKFEQRTEAGTAFYVHKDAQSSRIAAFASKDGWLILGTRDDLVAGVLDQLAGTASHSLSNEGWYAEVVHDAQGERGDLRMVLDLDKIVRTPYFRSYWAQNNITEMKQYTAAVSDLYRSGQSYREERMLLRRPGVSSAAQGDIRALASLAPADATFYEAQASPNTEDLLKSLRDNLLELKPAQSQATATSAPSAAVANNAGSASQLDVFIDQAPASAPRSDVFQSLRTLLAAQQPDAVLEVYSSRSPQKDITSGSGVFVTLQTAMVVSAPQVWDEAAVRSALTVALPTNLTAGKIGTNWVKHSGASGEYLALDGALPLYAAVNGKQLFLANDTPLLQHLLASRSGAAPAGTSEGVTYAAVFRPAREQSNFSTLMAQLDLAGHRGSGGQQAAARDGQSPAFFSGNVSSLDRAFFNTVASERIEERDMGAKVTQTVTYQW